MKIAQPKIGMTVVLLMYCQTNGILSSISGIQKKGKIWLDPPYSRPIMPLSMVVDFIYTGCALDGSRGQVLLHIQFTIMPLSCYGVFRFIMERGDKGCEVIVSGKLRAQRAKSIKFKDGYMISSGQKEPCFMFVYF